MADENYSTYQWVPNTEGSVNISRLNITEPSWWTALTNSEETTVTVDVTITHNNIFALIVGTYQVKVIGTKNSGGADPVEVYCTYNISEPKLCIKESDDLYKINLTLSGEINYELFSGINEDDYDFSCQSETFGIQQGIDNEPNKYLCILQKPKLINLSINGRGINDTYVKGSALPINEIENISTIDFHNITINGVQRDIFSKLENNISVTTNDLSFSELTVVDLPESEDKTIYICKSRSKNKGITFRTSEPDTSRKHFGYIIDIEGDRSAGYKTVWVNRETLDKMFTGMPEDIMSNTDKFVFDKDFELHELTYEIHDVVAPDWVNNKGQKFSNTDKGTLTTYAPTYKKVTINESTEMNNRQNNMILKNIEFVKFGDKVIKLNYKPLYEA